ncbi:MAG TPA: SDR family NAD(P)-dependent oxidoreductase [Patescibacteria group bacterium]|nr:SDR family NAD(P)-dependent oxidoreductase [Patescibacteria group bacterium]
MQKVILVSGGTRGIGREAVFLLLQEGHKVAAFSRNGEKTEALQASLAEKFSPENFLVLQGDVRNKESLQIVVTKTIAKFSNIDVLLNNAGYGIFASIEDMNIVEFRDMMETNVIGLAQLTQLVVPYMKKQKSGLILNIASVAAKKASSNGEYYNATKFGLQGYSQGTRLELKPFGIKVCTVNPGMVRTDFFTEEALKRRCENYGLPYPPPLLEAADIAWVISCVVNQPAHVDVQDIDIMPF